MKIRKVSFARSLILLVALMTIIPIVSPGSFSVYGQVGNSITGYVFGLQRQPIENVDVELLDDLNRTVDRTRTNGSGFYSFYKMSAGRFRIRVMPFATDYEEQTGDVEIVNITRQTGDGGSRVGGFENAQRDFYLKIRKDATGKNTAIFVQEIPDPAKKLYEKAVESLKDKKDKEAFESLKAALEIFPKYYVALELLGTEYIRLKYYEAAQILLSIAVDVNPRGYRSWYGLAYSLYSLNKFDESMAAVQKTLEITPNWAEPLLLSGVLLRQNKKFDEAEKQLLKAKEMSRGSTPMVHWHLALLYGNDLKKYAEAAKELKLFLKEQPDSKDAETIKKLIKEFEDKASKS